MPVGEIADNVFMRGGAIFKPIARLAARSGASRWVSRFTDRFQIKKNSLNEAIFPFIKRRAHRSCQILAYHRINDENDQFFPGLPIKRFERQMELLADQFTLCSLDELPQRMKDDDLPENAVSVTLDDGYRDNYLNAFPILQKYSVPATIFLATGVIGSKKKLWHDRVFNAFNNTSARALGAFGPKKKALPLDSLENKLSAQSYVLEYLWSLNHQDRELAVDNLHDRLEVAREETGEDNRLMLSWEEVAEMSHGGIRFGAHTVNHPILSRLASEDARREVYSSKHTIEKKLKCPVTSFAYPVGRRADFTATTKAIIAEAGFQCGVTMVLGNNEVGIDRYELRRIAPWDEDPEIFGLRLSAFKFCY